MIHPVMQAMEQFIRRAHTRVEVSGSAVVRPRGASRRQALPYPGLIPAALVAALALSSCVPKPGTTGKTDPDPPAVEVTRVISQPLSREIILPGEILAFQDVPIYPKVPGFIQWIGIDRGSVVKKNQVLSKLIAPELEAAVQEARANVNAADAALTECRSRLVSEEEQRQKAMARHQADADTYKRLATAARVPGVVSENEVEVAQKTAEADLAQVRSAEALVKATQALVKVDEEKIQAARKQLKSRSDIKAYLTVTAPFDGVITERNTHTGSFVGPPAGPVPMVRIRELSLLRLVIPVPEIAVGSVKEGEMIFFTVPAYPGRKFNGVIRRIGHYLDEKTRTMPVELDVYNPDWKLSPGMFPDVIWPATRTQPSLFVPSTAVATTSERTFLVRVRNGVVSWIDVRRGQPMGDRVEVFGEIAEGDEVAVTGTDELKEGQRVIATRTKAAPAVPSTKPPLTSSRNRI